MLDKVQFTKLIYDGVPCIMTNDDAQDIINEAMESGDPLQGYKSEYVYMTQKEFDAMEEFTGW